jgi:hypothetical protein
VPAVVVVAAIVAKSLLVESSIVQPFRRGSVPSTTASPSWSFHLKPLIEPRVWLPKLLALEAVGLVALTVTVW